MDPREAIARWDAFLAKLAQRARDTLAEAEQGCVGLLDLNDLDPLPMSNAWTAIENQLRELGAKVEQTWAEKVEPALEAAGWSAERTEAERGKGGAYLRGVEREQAALELRLFAGAARRILEQAKANLARDFACRQCGAPLKVSDRFFRSRQVPCPFCSSVNTFVPGAQVAAVEHFCCHHLAREKTQGLWDAWMASETAMRSRSDDAAARQTAERALREYTEAYLRARIEIVPEFEKDFERDLKGKMAFFYA